MRISAIGLAAVAALLLSGCGYNALQAQDEQVKSAWSEVINQYQRRADLIPNLVNTVKGYAAQEQTVLLGVTQARAKVGSMQATPELVNDPEAFAKFQAAQGELSGALSRLMVVTENYPQLKSDQNFRDLQAQLEGTENRITVARNRYIQAVQKLQCHGAFVPRQFDGDGVRLQAEAEFHGRERSGDLQAAQRGFLGAAGRRRRRISVAAARREAWWRASLRCWRARMSPCRRSPPASSISPAPCRAGRSNRIETRLADLEAKKGSQIAVLMVPTTQPEEIEQYGIRVAEHWKLGRKGVDDGAILLVAKDDRRVRIEVGYGLEGALPDAIANRIIDETITPHFKLGDYDGGVEAGVEQMISVVNGEPLPAPDRKVGAPRRHRPSAAVPAGRGIRRQRRAAVDVRPPVRLDCDRRPRRRLAWLLSHVLLVGAGAGLLAFLFAMLLGSTRAWSAGGGGWGGGFGGGLGGFGGFRRRFQRRGRRLQRRGRRLRRRRRLGKLVMQFARLVKHAAATHWRTRMLFPARTLDAIEQAIGRVERAAFGRDSLRDRNGADALARAVRVSRRERARSRLSAHLKVWDTELNNGVLIYVQLADRSVEIVADRGFAGRVSPGRMGCGLPADGEHFRAGRLRGRLDRGGRCHRRAAGAAFSGGGRGVGGPRSAEPIA